MPAITKPNLHFDATTYTGTGSALSVTNGGFQPDFVWIKSRAIVAGHGLVDSVRGRASVLYSNDTAAQGTSGSTQDVTAFNSNGFALGTNSQIESNTNASTYVAWQWKAGGTAVTNTSGTISSQVSANPTAGFSVVTYTGNGTAGATIGHGIGVAPSMVIVKNRSAGGDSWQTYHIGSGAAYRLFLNSTGARVSDPIGAWNSGTPTTTVFTAGSNNSVNGSGVNYVAYCWAPIEGYSAFGSFTGNGNANGPFVYTGFRPAFVMAKLSSATGDWNIVDDMRQTYNDASGNPVLRANLTSVEEDVDTMQGQIDLLSNGFKLRSNSSSLNASGGTIIYAAFAEAPQKYANAR